MRDWIKILVAFANDDKTYEFGTKKIEDLKVVTAARSIEIKPDLLWDKLIGISKIFAGTSV